MILTPSSLIKCSVVRRLHSSQSSGMESSVLRFKNVNFIVGKGDKKKNILSDVSGTVKWGRKFACVSPRFRSCAVVVVLLTKLTPVTRTTDVLAVMGPSGAGKASSLELLLFV